jgi:MFS family permease
MWALLRVSPDPGRRRTALAGWSAGGAVAGVLGYVVGGGLTQALSWHWVFWVNGPITVVLIVGVLFLVPADRSDAEVRPDVWGAVLLTAAIMALVGAASALQDGRIVLGSAGLGVGAALGAGFAAQQRRAADPLGLTALPEGGTSGGFLAVTAAGVATAIWLRRSSRRQPLSA